MSRTHVFRKSLICSVLSRRDFLKAAMATGAVSLLAGCRPAGSPLAAVILASSTPPKAPAPAPASTLSAPAEERWAASANMNIAIYSGTQPVKLLTSGSKDYKPSWSLDGSMLTFFRAYRYGPDFKDWRSSICVINADGTGFRELTSAEYPNFNPTWTRDGSQRILFNRFSTTGDSRNQVFWTVPSAKPGDEQLISDPQYLYFEWVHSGIRDGRVLVDRFDASSAKSYLLTPDPGKRGKYEEIERPTTLLWHKLSVSPSETKVAYMLDYDGNIPTYDDSVICYAQFDVKALKIHHQVEITEKSMDTIEEYPAWNRDESLLVYDSNRSGVHRVYAYRLANGETTRFSTNTVAADYFAAFEGCPK
jgi:Tol biopolymer transport system component